MEFLNTIPIWLLALVIFCLRVVDVSLGTIRTLSIFQGFLKLAVVLGFFEILVWVTAIFQVISRLHESPLLMVAYAAGFAAGNGVGMLIERKMALGVVVLRIISRNSDQKIVDNLRGKGYGVTTFLGEGKEGPVTLIYLSLKRNLLEEVLTMALQIDPTLFYVVEPAREWSKDLKAVAYHTGWRSPIKKK